VLGVKGTVCNYVRVYLMRNRMLSVVTATPIMESPETIVWVAASVK
jgi:hypothetical protein